MKTPCTLEHVRGTGSLWTPMAWPCQLLSLPDRRSSCSCGTTAQPRRQCSRAKLQLLQQLPAPAPDRLCVLDPTLRNILPQARNVNIALCMPMSSLLTQQESGTYPAAAIFHDREPLACGRSAIQSQPDTCYLLCMQGSDGSSILGTSPEGSFDLEMLRFMQVTQGTAAPAHH